MKKLLGLFVIAILLTSTINAQERKGRIGKRADFTPEQIAELHTKRLTLNFDLDKNQQKAVYDLKKKQAEECQIMRKNFRQKNQNGIKPTSDERFQFKNNQLERQLETKNAMKNILQKDQFEKWEKISNAKMKYGRRYIDKPNRVNQGCIRKNFKNDGRQSRFFKNRS
jgi:Skp family chaperone for outer membrane proteins